MCGREAAGPDLTGKGMLWKLPRCLTLPDHPAPLQPSRLRYVLAAQHAMHGANPNAQL